MNDPPTITPQSSPADRRPWMVPLRVHLSVLIIALLVCTVTPIVWLAFERGRSAAISAALQQMQLLSQRTVDHFRLSFGDASAMATMASASDPFLFPPPHGRAAKTKFLLTGLTKSSHLDGIYAGYPGGEFIHAVSLANNPAWRKVLAAPANAKYALRIIEPAIVPPRVSTWSFLDGAGRLVGNGGTTAANYDPRERPWYRLASVSIDPVAVGPYVFATTKALGLTVAERLVGKPEIVVGVDVLLDTISRFIADERVSPNARAYVFDALGRLTIHSDAAMMDRILIRLAETPDVQASELALGDPVLDAVLAEEVLRGNSVGGAIRFFDSWRALAGAGVGDQLRAASREQYARDCRPAVGFHG